MYDKIHYKLKKKKENSKKKKIYIYICMIYIDFLKFLNKKSLRLAAKIDTAGFLSILIISQILY